MVFNRSRRGTIFLCSCFPPGKINCLSCWNWTFVWMFFPSSNTTTCAAVAFWILGFEVWFETFLCLDKRLPKSHSGFKPKQMRKIKAAHLRIHRGRILMRLLWVKCHAVPPQWKHVGNEALLTGDISPSNRLGLILWRAGLSCWDF